LECRQALQDVLTPSGGSADANSDDRSQRILRLLDPGPATLVVTSTTDPDHCSDQ